MKGHLPSVYRCCAAVLHGRRVRAVKGSNAEWFSRVDSAQGLCVFPSGHTRVLTKEHFRLHPYWDTISARTMKRSDERFRRTIREKTL